MKQGPSLYACSCALWRWCGSKDRHFGARWCPVRLRAGSNLIPCFPGFDEHGGAWAM